MALSSTGIIEVRAGGSDNNGGGFNSAAAGTDRSQQDAAFATLTTASLVNATTTIIDVDAGDFTCSAADVGNYLQITGGSATAGVYQITARSSQQWTLDRSAGTSGQTVAGSMGGAFASPGMAASIAFDGMTVYIAGGVYTLTTPTINVAGGPLDDAMFSPSSTSPITFEGYGTARGDKDTTNQPILTVPASGTYNLYVIDGSAVSYYIWSNIRIDGSANATAGLGGFAGGATYQHVDRIYVTGTNSGRNSISTGNGNNPVFSYCVADACDNDFDVQAVTLYCCVSKNNTGSVSGFSYSSNSRIIRSIADSNGGDGFQSGSIGGVMTDCISYNNGGDGFQTGSLEVDEFYNCIAYGNGGFGWNGGGTNARKATLVDCAGDANTSGELNSAINDNAIIERFTTLTADPFVNAAAEDFNINDTAGGGTVLRALTRTIAGDV